MSRKGYKMTRSLAIWGLNTKPIWVATLRGRPKEIILRGRPDHKGVVGHEKQSTNCCIWNKMLFGVLRNRKV